MRVAVVDVGSNTARLLVANVTPEGVEAVVERKLHLGLGEEIATTGTLSRSTLDDVARVCARFARRIRDLQVERAETIVTAPGRQGRDPLALVRALQDATGLHVRVLSSDEEGRLAYEGAVARLADDPPEVVGVVDVGGGSTEVVVGTPLLGAAWVRSVDLGSLRLTHQLFGSDPPTRRELARARAHVAERLGAIGAPRPDLALAAGGSARAVARVLGLATFDAAAIDEAATRLAAKPSAANARRFGLNPLRAASALGGALLLAEAARALDRPLELAGGGIREGAALALATAPVAAAA